MTDFKKGYWNLEELKIVEWIDQKQNGFMEVDVVDCRNRILEDLTFYGGGESIPPEVACNIVKKIFGDL